MIYVLILRDPGQDEAPPFVHVSPRLDAILTALRQQALDLITDVEQSDGTDFGLKQLRGDLPTMTSMAIIDALKQRFDWRIYLLETTVLP